MGQEAKVTATLNGAPTIGVAKLETTELRFRGVAFALVVPFSKIRRVSALKGCLALQIPDGTLTLEIGQAAAKWAEKIRHPPSRLEKIGVRPGWRVSTTTGIDPDFVAELRRIAALVSVGRVLSGSDAIFVAVRGVSDLSRLKSLRASLRPAGALWTIRPKAHPEISERAVLAAGKTAGLVDVKVVSFSSTHTAQKFVVPLKDR